MNIKFPRHRQPLDLYSDKTSCFLTTNSSVGLFVCLFVSLFLFIYYLPCSRVIFYWTSQYNLSILLMNSNNHLRVYNYIVSLLKLTLSLWIILPLPTPNSICHCIIPPLNCIRFFPTSSVMILNFNTFIYSHQACLKIHILHIKYTLLMPRQYEARRHKLTLLVTWGIFWLFMPLVSSEPLYEFCLVLAHSFHLLVAQPLLLKPFGLWNDISEQSPNLSPRKLLLTLKDQSWSV